MKTIRVKLDRRYKESASGPNMFMSRLVRVLEKDYKIEFVSKKSHIDMGVIFLPESKPGAKRVVRVDGCYYNKATGTNMNKYISKAIRKADGVIYQSEFSKKLCDKLLKCKPKKYSVIYNGIDQNWIRSIQPKSFTEKNVFAAIANWRTSKRPRSIIKSFLKANIPDSRLLIIGKFDKKIKHDNISYLGKLNSDEIISCLKGCKSLIHICKIESCPNAVIESLSCGVPVICNNIGGTKEIVKNDGIVVECDDQYEFDFINDKNVDNINPSIISPALELVVSRQWDIKRDDLSIQVSAEKYRSFFEFVLE